MYCSDNSGLVCFLALAFFELSRKGKREIDNTSFSLLDCPITPTYPTNPTDVHSNPPTGTRIRYTLSTKKSGGGPRNLTWVPVDNPATPLDGPVSVLGTESGSAFPLPANLFPFLCSAIVKKKGVVWKCVSMFKTCCSFYPKEPRGSLLRPPKKITIYKSTFFAAVTLKTPSIICYFWKERESPL